MGRGVKEEDVPVGVADCEAASANGGVVGRSFGAESGGSQGFIDFSEVSSTKVQRMVALHVLRLEESDSNVIKFENGPPFLSTTFDRAKAEAVVELRRSLYRLDAQADIESS